MKFLAETLDFKLFTLDIHGGITDVAWHRNITNMIMVEFQIECGFKFEFMPFLCGVPVPGRGV